MKTIFSCFFCLFCLFTIGCTHQSSQENCVEIGSADSICLQKELYTLHKYVDSIIKIYNPQNETFRHSRTSRLFS